MVLVGSADDEIAARTVPSECINPGEELTVTIELPVIGVSGLVVETLCEGWSYTSTSLEPYQVTEEGNTITFTLAGDTTFTYVVTAPDIQDASCTIAGIFKDMNRVDWTIGADTFCTCPSGVTPPTLVRTVPADCIDCNTTFTVTVETPGTGVVIETLCDDWTYVSSSLDACQVTTDGNAVTFTLENDASFTYTVQAPDTENAGCTIQGIFSIDNVDHNFIEDFVCTRESGVTPPTLVRTVPTDCIDRNTQFTVTVETPGTGLVTETLCNDWTYVSSSLDACQVITDGNTVTFTLINDTSFTYTVQAPATEDVCCTIQGIFRDMDKVDHDFKDDSVCTCVDVPPTDTPKPEPTEIPEFPTLILPITAILGLMFLLARKK